MNSFSIADLKFSPLHLAMVIESRFSLRRDIVHLIQSLYMFEDVVEARSISDGYGIIDLRAVDCCILGVGLHETNAAGFAERGKNSGMSKDCAFIKLATQGEMEHELESFDLILEMPTTKARLAEAIIRSVIRANKNSPWSGVLLNSGLTEDQFVLMLSKEGALRVGEKVSDLTDSLSQSGVRKSAAKTLANILKSVTDETVSKMDDAKIGALKDSIVSQLFKTTGLPEDLLEQVIGEWLHDRQTLSHQQSMKILERKLTKQLI